MIDNEFVKTKLRELENIKASLQGKIEISFPNIIALSVVLIGIAYFIYIDIQEGDNELPVFMIIVGVAFIYIETKMKVANKKIDMVIKLLDLEKLADQRYTDQIKEISSRPQTSGLNNVADSYLKTIQTTDGGTRNHTMKKKIIISVIVVYVINSLLLSPNDPLTALFYGVTAAFICCVALLILARYEFVKSSPNSMQTLVCILVCMVSVLLTPWIIQLFNKIIGSIVHQQ